MVEPKLGSPEPPKAWHKTALSPIRKTGRAGVAQRDKIKLRDSFTCQRCGLVTTELEIDHIVPLSVSNDDSDENQQALCRDCHAIKTAVDNSGSAVSNMPEWLPVPLIPVIVVCGPPGSGKSTHVKQNAGPRDLVLDVDEIAARVTGKPIYHATREDRDTAIRYRNTLLARLGRYKDADRYRQCWLIVTASTRKVRQFWEAYASKTIVLNPGIDECRRRIEADERRPESAKRDAIMVAEQWGA